MKRLPHLTAVLTVGVLVCLSGCPGGGPTASFSAAPRVGQAPLEVQFTDQSTSGSATITAWEWDFGDGAASTLQSPSHVYADPGTYSVSLKVTTSKGSDEKTVAAYVIADPENENTILLPGDVPLTVVRVSPGTFTMGAEATELGVTSADRPAHEVTLSQGYWLGKYEVTKAQWKAIVGTEPWKDAGFVLDNPDSPAVLISWNDMQTFISELNTETGLTFRLPYEAEWEYACRAGTTARFYWGEDLDLALIDDYAWNAANAANAGQQYAHVVGQKEPNAWGFYDMSGNAWEWCQDWYGNYPDDPVTDPTGPVSGSSKVVRGGSWYNPTPNSTCRSAYRGGMPPADFYTDYGFRLCRPETP